MAKVRLCVLSNSAYFLFILNLYITERKHCYVCDTPSVTYVTPLVYNEISDNLTNKLHIPFVHIVYNNPYSVKPKSNAFVLFVWLQIMVPTSSKERIAKWRAKKKNYLDQWKEYLEKEKLRQKAIRENQSKETKKNKALLAERRRNG